ncbi:MAG TPA: cyclic nucleotide-binding domain-containing protein [Thermoanaerobaculia bacterium]|jgi:cAMP-dependent protein kinase regulator
MPEETESGATLLARREYGRAVPVLKREHEKYPSNPRIRLQYADALAGAEMYDEAITQYEATARYYEDNGLTVQAIAVRKKAEKVRDAHGTPANAASASEPGKNEPMFSKPVPKSPLFEMLNDEERAAFVREMELETHDEGSVIINEGDPGTSMYLVASGGVKVYTRGTGGTVYLANLGEGDFFGEVSVLTGKPRTATITASQRTELLRLDKEKLDNALATYPGIRKVLDEFYKKRATHTVEAMIENLRKKGT